MIYLLMIHFRVRVRVKFSYQIFLTRTYAKELDSFYTTSFAILKKKNKKHIKCYLKNWKKMLIHVTIILELNQKICIVILKGPFLKQQKQYFLIPILNIAFSIIKITRN